MGADDVLPVDHVVRAAQVVQPEAAGTSARLRGSGGGERRKAPSLSHPYRLAPPPRVARPSRASEAVTLGLTKVQPERSAVVCDASGGEDDMTVPHPSHSRRDVVVVGASAGGVEALKTLAASLPPDLPATLLVVLHVPAYGRSVLPAILGRAGPLPARHVTGSSPLTPGEILVAPPDHHLVVLDSEVRATRGPRENGHRPAIDVLFRSAARALSHRVIGVELSGVLDDGAAGMWAVRNRGGLVVVQDPADCLYPEMPQSVMASLTPDHVTPAAGLGGLLDRLCREEFVAPELAPLSELILAETDLALLEEGAMNTERPGSPAGFSCPDCGGTLFEITEGALSRYRCRVGHAWTTKGLLGEQSVQLDTALWVALHTLEEKAALSTQLSERAARSGSPLTAARFEEQAADSKRAADHIRELIESRPSAEVELIDE